MRHVLATLVISSILFGTAQASPDRWVFERATGGTATLKTLRGPGRDYIMLVSWCSFCPSCRKVEKQIAQTASRYSKQVPIYILSVDRADSASQVETFLNSSKLDIPAVLDRQGQVTEELQLLTTTTAVIVDSKNQIRYRGAFVDKTGPVAERALQELLGGKEVSTPTSTENGCTFKHRNIP